MPKQVRAARHYQRDDDPVLRLSRSAMRGVARELKHAFNNLSSMVPVDKVAEAIRNGRDPKGLINWHHYREVLRGAFDRLGKLRQAGGALGARKINGVFAAKRRKVRFRKAGYTHFTSEGAVLGATKYAATRKASKAEAGYENSSTHGDHCSECWMFQAVWQCCAVEGVINPNGWCTYFETVFAKAYNPDEPRDERGRWTTGGAEEDDRLVGDRTITDGQGNRIAAPRTFYRAVNEGDSRRISTGVSSWDSLLFASDKPEGARPYGKVISRIDAKPEARILYEGTKEYRSLAAGLKGSLLDVSSGVAGRAAAAGYDAVWFKRQSDVGTAIINRAAFHFRGELTFGKAYNPDEPRDERGRWTSGGAQPPSPVPIENGGMDEFNSGELTRIFNGLEPNVLNALAANGVKLRLGDKLGDLRPELKGVTPRGWPKGMTWESAEGLYNRGSAEIIVTNKKLGWDGEYIESGRKVGVLLHETGHAFDAALGTASHNGDFQSAYHQDVLALSPKDKSTYSYFLQTGNAGLQETFAEAFAQLHGFRTGSVDMEKAFPASTKVVKNYIDTGRVAA